MKGSAQWRRLVIEAVFLVAAMIVLLLQPSTSTTITTSILSVGYYHAGRGEHSQPHRTSPDIYTEQLGTQGSKPGCIRGRTGLAVVRQKRGILQTRFRTETPTPAVVDFLCPHGRLMPWWMPFACRVGPCYLVWRKSEAKLQVAAQAGKLLGFTSKPMLFNFTGTYRAAYICRASYMLARDVWFCRCWVLRIAIRFLACCVEGMDPGRQAGVAFDWCAWWFGLAAAAWSTWSDYTADARLLHCHGIQWSPLLLTQVCSKARGRRGACDK